MKKDLSSDVRSLMVMMGWLISGLEFQVGLEIEPGVVWVGYDC